MPRYHHHQHHHGSSSSISGARKLLLFMSVALGGLYVGFFLASSPRSTSFEEKVGLHMLQKQHQANALLVGSVVTGQEGGGAGLKAGLSETEPKQPPPSPPVQKDSQEKARSVAPKEKDIDLQKPGPAAAAVSAQTTAAAPAAEREAPQENLSTAEAGQSKSEEGGEGGEGGGRKDQAAAPQGKKSTAEAQAAANPPSPKQEQEATKLLEAVVERKMEEGKEKSFVRPQQPDDGILECPGGRTYRRGDGNVVYWKRWNDETPMWTSPFKPLNTPDAPKYVTFEPDEGGFNNVRMSLEIIIIFALMTGRTLVLPDEYPMYLLGKKGLLHDMADFLEMDKLGKYLDLMQMKDFLAKEALTGQLEDGLRPPENRTTFERKRHLWEYIRSVSRPLGVAAESHVVAFNHSLDTKRWEAMSGGRSALEYDEELQQEKVIHFTSAMDGAIRYLAHFYGFYFHGDLAVDNLIKRFGRDQMHYKSEIFCWATKIVDLVRLDGGGSYNAIHIRRGDFQFKATRLPAEVIFANVEDIIEPGSLVYVMTDEHNATFFDPIRGKYRLRFMKDFIETVNLHEMNPNWSGMVEQIVASGAQNFVGCYFSTLTGYATRLRGYLGRDPGYYYLPEKKMALHDPKEFYARSVFFHREWPSAYTDIDGPPLKT